MFCGMGVAAKRGVRDQVAGGQLWVPSRPTRRPAEAQSPLAPAVWKAAAYGDFERLRELAEAKPELLGQPDEQGFYVAQWAALNNRIAVLTYLIDRGVDINAADATGQTALHWAAVRGAVQAAETLLRAGADLAAADSRGYTVCHVAAQYGQTGLLYHLAQRWHADTDSIDADGRTSLHWAAYKGFADTVRLLLFLGARVALADREGCTPLHWASIKGNSEACTVLVQGGSGEVLGQPDGSGATPSQLAIEKGHRLLGLHLADQKRRLVSEASCLAGCGAVGAAAASPPWQYSCLQHWCLTQATGLTPPYLGHPSVHQKSNRKSKFLPPTGGRAAAGPAGQHPGPAAPGPGDLGHRALPAGHPALCGGPEPAVSPALRRHAGGHLAHLRPRAGRPLLSFPHHRRRPRLPAPRRPPRRGLALDQGQQRRWRQQQPARGWGVQ